MAQNWASVKEVAEHLGATRSTIYRWITQEGLPGHKIGKRLWRFKLDEVDGWARRRGQDTQQRAGATFLPTALVTLDDLQTVGLSRDARDFFQEAFPNGAPSWQAVITHPDCPRYCRGEIAVRAPDLTLAERLEAAEQSDDPARRRGEIALSAPGLTFAERLDAAERSYDPPYCYSQIAVYAPGLTFAERLDAAERSYDPPYCYSQIAVRAPGLTFAERLDAAERSYDPPYCYSQIAVRAPGLTLAERLEAAERSDGPAYWRGRVVARWGTATQPQANA